MRGPCLHGLGHGAMGVCLRVHVELVSSCVPCSSWVRWVLGWGTSWNERRCESLRQHGQFICQGDITALTPHPSTADTTGPCFSWWLISIQYLPRCTAYTPPLPPYHVHTHTNKLHAVLDGLPTRAWPHTDDCSCSLGRSSPGIVVEVVEEEQLGTLLLFEKLVACKWTIFMYTIKNIL